MPGDIAVFPMYVMSDVFTNYQKCNGTVNKIYDNVALYSESASFMYNFPTLQIRAMKPKNPAVMATLLKQMDIPTLSGICMPLLDTDFDGFRTALHQWSDTAEQCGKDCVPQIAMNEDIKIFGEKLNLLKPA